MAQNQMLKRYLDAGMAFTQMTQARAEAIVKDLVKAGEVQAARTEELVNQIVERSKKNTERLLDQVRKEVRSQVSALGLASSADLERIERRLAQVEKATGATTKRAGKKKSARKKSATKKRSAGKKAGRKKSAAKTRPAKKRTAKKSTGR